VFFCVTREPTPSNVVNMLIMPHVVKWLNVYYFAWNAKQEDVRMRMLMNVRFPNEPFNSLVRAGKVGGIIARVLELRRVHHRPSGQWVVS
jgi:hypothetical protein